MVGSARSYVPCAKTYGIVEGGECAVIEACVTEPHTHTTPLNDAENFANFTPQVRDTLEQIGTTHQLAARYPDDVSIATTPSEVRAAWKAGKIAHLIGVEGAHSLGNSLAAIRMYAQLGVRFT